MKILRYLPLLAPIPEAWAVGLAIHRELNWWTPIVVVSSLIVAGTGVWGVQVFNRMNDLNATLYKDERALKMGVPTWQAVAVLAVWFAGVTLLTVFLDAVPLLATLTPLGLVVVGFSAAYLYSLSNLCATREAERLSHRQSKKQEKQSMRTQKQDERKRTREKQQELANIEQKVRTALQGQGTYRRPLKGTKLTDAVLLLEWTRDPYLTDGDMARLLVESGQVEKISRQAISQRRENMIKKGMIVQNPDGRVVEYIEVGAAAGQGSASGDNGKTREA